MESVSGGQAGAAKAHVLQIVGFKNSGKTTLAETLLRLASRLGSRVSVIKHHGHGGEPEAPPADTDASRLFGAGAASSVVSGGGLMLMQGRLPESDDGCGELDALIALTQTYARPDLILIEGFKSEAHPKIVLLRSGEDWAELGTLTNIVLVVTQESESASHPVLSAHTRLPGSPNVRLLHRQQTEEIEAWFAHWLRGAQTTV
ncbi:MULTISPECIES: molybdopterin-guanine dinucleotide biosynthesis protein B [Saccharibacillus]|uniref:molybdopterin-guanine dinucleotide biosynthesis protein B n=1 Tax=Saccharibacillus TaxID=456492 RepID=UPI001238BE5E|nr:molybdopterin-guanine dinucleotide biosynthesis protein B [Saccharibacillus sp. WB 17]MWJ30480.1 molybdopterin-guanine dinucleotide biosynthesis protein B [Saccharibacillus sp. WB 17]